MRRDERVDVGGRGNEVMMAMTVVVTWVMARSFIHTRSTLVFSVSVGCVDREDRGVSGSGSVECGWWWRL